MTCQTDDEAREKAYLHIVEVVDPWLKPRQFALMQKLAALALLRAAAAVLRGLSPQRRDAGENLPRGKRRARNRRSPSSPSSTRKSAARMTVQFDGKEQTLARMAPHPGGARPPAARGGLENRRRSAACRTPTSSKNLFDQLLVLRNEIAHAAGFADFRAYTFANYERFDYTPEDCLRFHDAIEHHIVPLARELQEERRSKLGVEKLRPWDLAVDPGPQPAAPSLRRIVGAARKMPPDFRQARPAARRLLPGAAPAGTGRSRQPQGQGARRLPEHAFRSARAVHLHERGRRPSRRRDHAARGRPRLSRAGLARAAAARLPQRADRILRGRLDGHGTAGRASPARLLFRRGRAAAPSAITSRASSSFSRGWPRSTRSSTGSTPIPATPATSAPRSGFRSWTASAASRTRRGFEKSRATHLAPPASHFRDSLLLRRIRHRAARRAAALAGLAARSPRRARPLSRRASASAARVRCRNFSRPAASPSISPTKPSRRSCAT